MLPERREVDDGARQCEKCVACSLQAGHTYNRLFCPCAHHIIEYYHIRMQLTTANMKDPTRYNTVNLQSNPTHSTPLHSSLREEQRETCPTLYPKAGPFQLSWLFSSVPARVRSSCDFYCPLSRPLPALGDVYIPMRVAWHAKIRTFKKQECERRKKEQKQHLYEPWADMSWSCLPRYIYVYSTYTLVRWFARRVGTERSATAKRSTSLERKRRGMRKQHNKTTPLCRSIKH